MLIITGIFLALSLGQNVAAAEFSVGFNLNLDYGTASIYYANGTTAGIAKIEGGAGYKQMMRSQAWILPHTDPAEGLAESAVYRKGQPVTTLRTRLQGFREQVPLWLGGNVPDDNIKLLTGMIQSLKKAVEAYTEVEEVHVAGVVFPARPSASLTETIFEAGRKLSLKVHISSGAGYSAAYADHLVDRARQYRDVSYWMYNSCGPDRLVLTIDASRAALTTFVFFDECSMYDAVRGFHDTSLGKDAWSNDSEWRIEISEALGHIVDPAVHRDDGSTLDHIDHLVVLGESADDFVLESPLFETLMKTGSGSEALELTKSDVDPLFAASIGAAALAWKAEDKTQSFSCVD